MLQSKNNYVQSISIMPNVAFGRQPNKDIPALCFELNMKKISLDKLSTTLSANILMLIVMVSSPSLNVNVPLTLLKSLFAVAVLLSVITLKLKKKMISRN